MRRLLERLELHLNLMFLSYWGKTYSYASKNPVKFVLWTRLGAPLILSLIIQILSEL